MDFHCESLEMPGITTDGGFAEYLVVSERSVLRAEGDPVELAPMADAGATSYHAAKKAAANLVPGDFVAVFGIGGLEQIGLQVILELTPADVIAVDVREVALTLASQLGADFTINAAEREVPSEMDTITDGRGVAQALDLAG